MLVDEDFEYENYGQGWAAGLRESMEKFSEDGVGDSACGGAEEWGLKSFSMV